MRERNDLCRINKCDIKEHDTQRVDCIGVKIAIIINILRKEMYREDC